jgi:hypothetical protein
MVNDMNAQPNLPTPRPSRWRRIAIIFGVLLCVYVAYRLTLHFIVEAKLDEIRKQGYPVTLAELDKWYPTPPPGENAANVYEQAFAQLNIWSTNEDVVLRPAERRRRQRHEPTNSVPTLVSVTVYRRELLPVVGNAKLPLGSQALSNEVRSLIGDYLADNAEPLRLLHVGTSVSRCRYPVDLTKGFEAPLAHLNKVRNSAKLLALECILQSEDGNGESATKTIIDGFRFAGSIEQEPLLISQLVRIACQGITLSGLERMLNRTTPTDTELSQIAAVASEAEASETVIRGFVGEMACHDAIFRTSVSNFAGWVAEGWLWTPLNTKKTYIVAPLIALYRATGLMDIDQLSYLRGMEGYIEACRKPLPLRLSASESCRTNAENLPRWRFLSKMFLPALSNCHVKEAGAVARLRAARIALMIERYRLANGELPNSLGDLVSKLVDAIPADPFDGKPLRYKKLAKGYVVYSVGENGKDDGGDETISARTNWRPADITFTVER